jgi:hypothetical protein
MKLTLKTCKARVIGDQYHCSRCGYVWDIADKDPPACKPDKKPKSK